MIRQSFCHLKGGTVLCLAEVVVLMMISY